MPNMNDNSEEKPMFSDWLYAESRWQNRISRQALQFYQTNYGFKEPLNVICSSSFLQKWRSAGEIKQRLSSVLKEKAVIWASNCIVQELGGGGYDGLKVYSCDHQSSMMSGKSCISQIAKQQSSKLVFATDNMYLSKKLLKLAGVPVLLLKNNVLMLMKPSPAQRQFAKAEAEAEEFAKQRKSKAGKAGKAEEFAKQRKSKAGKAGKAGKAEEFAKQRKSKAGKAGKAEEFAKQRKSKAGKAGKAEEAEEFGKQRKMKAGKAEKRKAEEAEELAKQRKRKSH